MNLYFDKNTFNILPVGLIILIGIVFLMWRKKKDKVYLLILFAFGLYILFLLRVTLFPIPLYSSRASIDFPYSPRNLNLIPLYFGECRILRYCLFGSIANVYLTIPFGFGVYFLSRVNKKKVFWFSIFIGL